MSRARGGGRSLAGSRGPANEPEDGRKKMARANSQWKSIKAMLTCIRHWPTDWSQGLRGSIIQCTRRDDEEYRDLLPRSSTRSVCAKIERNGRRPEGGVEDGSRSVSTTGMLAFHTHVMQHVCRRIITASESGSWLTA